MSPRAGHHPGRLQGPRQPEHGLACLLLARVSLGTGGQTETDALRPPAASPPVKPYSHGTGQAGGWLTLLSGQR